MFKSSKEYWDNRYKRGGNSGIGSYGKMSRFKADVINKYSKDNDVKTVCEFGCGDGNQLSLFKFEHYTGYDISETVIEKCKKMFSDTNKKFYNIQDYNEERYDLALSLDVIYHLVENSVFETYMTTLFNSSDNILIYSSNFDDTGNLHVRHRKFTNWIDTNRSDFKMIKNIKNIHPDISSADFFMYKK